MADFSFLHVFGVSLVVTTLRTTLFNPMTLIKSTATKAMTGGAKPGVNTMQAMMGGVGPLVQAFMGQM